ncbi:hypothetical protein V8E54_001505 [Elaphomyces granulatus]
MENISGTTKRFLPQPVEKSTRNYNYRRKSGTAETQVSSEGRLVQESIQKRKECLPKSTICHSRRPLPQPFEISSRSFRCPENKLLGSKIDCDESLSRKSKEWKSGKPVGRPLLDPITSVKPSKRQGIGCLKTTGELEGVETRDRSGAFQGEITSTLFEGENQQFSKHVGQLRHKSLPLPSYALHVTNNEVDPHSQESGFSYTTPQCQQERRRHAFRVPDLPVIPSNSSERSEGSDVPSLSTSPSISSDESVKRSNVRERHRQSCDETFSGYLLSLASRSADRQLRDQALAAFPNEQVHQSVSHFAIDREEDSECDDHGAELVLQDMRDEASSFRRESTADIQWELGEMRRHKEDAEVRECERNPNVMDSRFSPAALAAVGGVGAFSDDTDICDWQKEVGLVQMRYAASPPMLGGDLVFPLSFSPQGTGCESEQATIIRSEEDGLWCTNSHIDKACSGGGGLWMGLCQRGSVHHQSSSERPKLGISTPKPVNGGQSYSNFDGTVPAGKNSQLLADFKGLNDRDEMLPLGQEPEREFHDGFVTQVYNYLSLGYPSLARYYDYELSKITGIPIDELRRDDLSTDAKGYVDVHEDGGKCMRWTALRSYIKEWAKQPPSMVVSDSSLESWGVRGRRGSWAV